MKERKETISPLKMNLLSFVLLFIAAVVCGGLYVLALYLNLNDSFSKDSVINNIHQNINFLWLSISIIFGLFVHELIHAAVAVIFAKNGFKSINFGAKDMTLYCHCSDPLKVKEYTIVLLAPLVIMGIIPAIVGIVILNPNWVLFGIVFIAGAMGDIMVAWRIRKENPENTILDHPSEPGYLVYEPEEDEVKE